MAVRSLNPLEQHAGKIFLGVVLIICLTLVLRYVTGDPVKVEKGAQSLSVDQARQNVEKLNRDLADRIRPDAPCKQPPITPAGVDVDFNRVPAICNRPLANTGLPLPREGVLDIRKPPEVLVANLGLLTPLSRPKVASDEKVCDGKDVRYVSVAADIPTAALQAFREDLAQQGADKNVTLPENMLLSFYRLELQRQQVDDQGQAIGNPEDVPAYTDPRMSGPSDFHEKDNPFPGPGADPMLVREWVRWMVSAMGQGKPSYENWLAGSQPLILWPKLPAPAAGQPPVDPVVEGFVAPSMVNPNAGIPAGGAVPVMPPNGGAPALNPGEVPVAPPGDVAPAWPGVVPPGGPVAPARPSTIYALDTTVKPASRYVYRIRYSLFNPLLGQYKLRDDQNFQVRFAASGWSPWSQPVQTARDMYAWALRDGMTSEPVFRVRRKVKGMWYQADFPVRIGEPVGRVMVPPRGSFEVDFRTGLIPVDVRDEDIMLRSVEPSGRVTLTLRQDTQVVLRDAAGRLTSRSIEIDSSEFEREKRKVQN